MKAFIAALAVFILSGPAYAAETHCVTTVTTITTADHVPLSGASQLIDRVCGLTPEMAFNALYVRKGLLGALYVRLAEEIVGGGGADTARIRTVYGD